MGFPTTLSMSLVSSISFEYLDGNLSDFYHQGMVVGWAILSPLSKLLRWAPGPVGDMSTGARGWILWISLAIMCADSLVSLLPIIYESIEKVMNRKPNEGNVEPEDEEVETEDRLVPIRWVLWGSGAAVFLGTVLVWFVFGSEGIKPWATVLGFALGGLLSLLG